MKDNQICKGDRVRFTGGRGIAGYTGDQLGYAVSEPYTPPRDGYRCLHVDVRYDIGGVIRTGMGHLRKTTSQLVVDAWRARHVGASEDKPPDPIGQDVRP